MAIIEDSEFYTVAQAARRLGVHPSTIWRWIDAERLPAYRVGPKSIRIKASDLDEMVQPAKPQAEGVASIQYVHAVEQPYVPRRRTPEEKERALKWLEQAAATRAAITARRGGQPFPDSWEEINQARDERSRHLLDL